MDNPPNNPLDLRGLKCPLPAMLARKALARLAPGARLTVLADDPMAVVDVPHMCHREGHTVEGVTRHPSHTEFILCANSSCIRPAEGAAADPDGDRAPDPQAPHPGPDAR